MRRSYLIITISSCAVHCILLLNCFDVRLVDDVYYGAVTLAGQRPFWKRTQKSKKTVANRQRRYYTFSNHLMPDV